MENNEYEIVEKTNKKGMTISKETRVLKCLQRYQCRYVRRWLL